MSVFFRVFRYTSRYPWLAWGTLLCAILSTLKLWRPWDAEHTGLGEPRRPPAPA